VKSQKFNVTGMTCSACSARIEKNLNKAEGIKVANVNLLSNSMRVEYDENILNESDIVKIVQDTGYGALSEESKKAHVREDQKSDAQSD